MIVKLQLITASMNKEPIIFFSILWDLEILGRPNQESTQVTSIGKGPLIGPIRSG